jgi:hypothetical protein
MVCCLLGLSTEFLVDFGDKKENPSVEFSEKNKHNNAMAEMQRIKVRIGDLSFDKGFGFSGLFMVAIEGLK